MLGLTNFFRTVVRQTPRLRPSSITGASSHVSYSTSTESAQNVNQELVNVVFETQEMVQAESTPFGRALQGAEYNPAKVENAHRLKGFYPGKFLSPASFSRTGRLVPTSTRRPRRPLIGPSRAESERQDVFRQLNIDPLHEALNSTLMSQFVTSMGKIKSRADTQLTWRSQRKLGKAIRRAKMMGVIPIMSRRALTAMKTY